MGTLGAGVWAQETFGNCDLGDRRRTKRLVALAEGYAGHIGASTVVSCHGNEAKVEAAYRFIRNDKIEARAILDGGFSATRKVALERDELLAIEDTTSLSYLHQVSEQLGHIGSSKDNKAKGFEVHSVLLLDAKTYKTIGLIEQSWWTRDAAEFGKKHQRRQRAYGDKESYKWEQASRRVSERLGNKMSNVLSVCDRESDIYEYLHYKYEHEQRYVVRASNNRTLLEHDAKLFEVLESSPLLGHYTVDVQQKGGRKARKARCALRAATVYIKAPQYLRHLQQQNLKVNALLAEEVESQDIKPEDKLKWIILSTEPIGNFASAERVIQIYELRWRIEDYHKAWKSGVGVEELRLQDKDNLQRVGSILAFVAVRLLQMKELVGFTEEQKKLAETTPCTEVLTEDEWKILWLTLMMKRLPKKAPSIKWAYHSIAKLGGWYDSKRTGIVGWKAIWEGWFRLQERLEAYVATKRFGWTV